MTRYSLFLICLLSLLFTSCITRKHVFAPQVSYHISSEELQQLPKPFPPLSAQELALDWGKELKIGQAFASQLDLFKAITSFQRAVILMPQDAPIERREELHYDIVLSYFLGEKYAETIEAFEDSPLRRVGSTFPAFNNLLIMLYQSYVKVGDSEKAQKILELLDQSNSSLAVELNLSTALQTGNIEKAKELAVLNPHTNFIAENLDTYEHKKKSIQKAWALNALLPGAGYLYVGQKSSAITSFLINGLFIWAAYEFFDHGFKGAGIITTVFELGWYFGGINGAGFAANSYNERLYEDYSRKILKEQRLFPALMLNYQF